MRPPGVIGGGAPYTINGWVGGYLIPRAATGRPYGAPQERTCSCKRSPHPPQRARWGTFPQGKAWRAAKGRPYGAYRS